MTNFSPEEQRSLMALLSGLQGGMQGSQGESILQSILGQQQTRMADRQQRMGSLTDLITNAAGSGQSLEAAQALAGAYTRGSNIPPQIQDVLGSLYPGSQPTADTGGTPGPGFNQSAVSQFQPDMSMQSPVYQPPPLSPQDQLAQMQLGQQVQDQSASASVAPQVSNALANQALAFIQAGQDPNSVIANLIASKTYASLDPTTQAMTIQAINDALQQAQQQQQNQQAQVPGGPTPAQGTGPNYVPGTLPGFGR